MSINKTGQLVDYIRAAVETAGAKPETEIRVRIGENGPEYRIEKLMGSEDQRGFRLLLQTSALPGL